MKKLLLAAVALVVLAAGPAVAADLGRKAPAYIPPPAPPPPSFTGCYVNGGAGYGLWNIDHFGNADLGGDELTSPTTSGGRGWFGTVGGGCDYQFGSGSGFWSNWVVGAFADYDFMDLHRNFQALVRRRRWRRERKVGLGCRRTDRLFGHSECLHVLEWRLHCKLALIRSTFPRDFRGLRQLLLSAAHTYHGWFIGGGTEIALSGFFGLPLPPGFFWRSEYRYSSFNSANLPVLDSCGCGSTTRHRKHEALCPDDHDLAGLQVQLVGTLV